MITWMTIALLFLVMVGLIIVATSLSSEKERKCQLLLLLLCAFIGITFTALWCNIMSLYEPKPIDVYRGYTELKITSVNGVPTDTVVVWKRGGNH